MSEKIIAIKQDTVQRLNIPLGLTKLKSDVVYRFLNEMEQEVCIEDRDFLEGNPVYRQLIPYPVIRYEDMIFAAVRTKKGGESRLHNLKSVGFGGHARPIEIGSNRLNLVEQLKLNAQRELDEELIIEQSVTIQFNGFINDLSNKVGKDHLGILVIVDVPEPDIRIREQSVFKRGKFYFKSDLMQNLDDLENWSHLVVTNI